MEGARDASLLRTMDVDSDNAAPMSNVDDWLSRFTSQPGSQPSAFPFTSNKIQSIESRRARMSDLLILDVLLIRGGIRNPDMLFPPADWTSLRKLLDVIDQSVYDVLKKDCLVYILLKWAWDVDTNPGWDARYVQDRCIAPQFIALADAYWLLDTGTHLAKAVSILSDARLNRDYVSKILQALSLSSSPASFASGNAPATATLIVNYVRTAKPLLTEPDDIDIYALSLAQLSFMDAWGYQKSFPEGSDTRERLLRKIVGWCLMPTPKQEPLAQLLAFPLSCYEESALYTLALPVVGTHSVVSFGPALSSQAISILQDLLCVRAIQSGDYIHAIKLDRQFSSVSPSLGSGTSSSGIASQAASSGWDTMDRRSIIQDLFAALPPAERTLLEDEIGKVATGVRASTSAFTPRQGPSAPVRRPLVTELSLSSSWEDVGRWTGSPAPSAPISVVSSAVGNGFAGKATPVPVSSPASPFAPHVSRPQPASNHPPPPKPKFTAFGSPISSTTGASTGRGIITERGRTLFASGAGTTSATQKFGTGVSLFDISGSAKNTPNAFYKPPSAPAGPASLDLRSALAGSNIARSSGQDANTTKQNDKIPQGENDGEDVNMGSDVEIVEDGHPDALVDKGHAEEAEVQEEEDDGNFLTYDKSAAADLTLHPHPVDEGMGEDDDAGLEFSVFNGNRTAVQNGGAVKPRERHMSGSGQASHASPPRSACVSPPRNGDKDLSLSVNSRTKNRRHALPGAFHHDEEDDDDRRDENENRYGNEEAEDDEDDRASLTTPPASPRRSTRTTMQPQTPPRPSARSQPQRPSKSTTTTTGVTGRPSARTDRASSGRPNTSHLIPGALMDEDDEHGQDDEDHMDMHGDQDTEMDDEEEDAIAPLPSRVSRRTRSSGNVGTSTSSPKSKSSAKPTVATGATTGKGKTKARTSDVRTPARRSSRLSIASSVSPDYTEAASPTKKGRRGTAPRASTGSGTGTVATRSSTRRKRKDT